MASFFPPRPLFLAVFCMLSATLLFAQGQQTPAYRQDRVIVKYTTSVPAVQLRLQSALNVKRSWRLRLIDAEVLELDGISADEAIARFEHDPDIEYIVPDYTVYAIGAPFAAADSQRFPNDPRFSEMWGLHNTGQLGGVVDADIDAPEAWSLSTGKDVIVGVIDSGVDYRHEDLAANIWTNPGEIPNNGIDDDGNGFIDDVRGWDFFENDNDPMDEALHGTHVAGTIAALGNNGIGTVGVNWNAKIMILRFLGPNGNGSTSDAIRAIEYAIMMGAKLTNNSWGGSEFSPALRDAIDAAGQAGQLFVAAAGNTGLNCDLVPHYPAAYELDNIISVANLTRLNILSSSSTYGPKCVDLAAPGTAILSTLPGNRYANFSGTSMASPHVAGVATLIWSVDPNRPALEVKDLILNTIDPVPALNGLILTGGRLNAHSALIAADPDSLPPAAVTDLQVVQARSNALVVQWTATGDDSVTGQATAYDIRYATVPIDAGNFDTATPVANPPVPQPAGTVETLTIDGLDFTTSYYIALRVIDNRGQASGVSNNAFGTTLGIPNIVVQPTALETTLLAGAHEEHFFTISNDAEGTLDFSITSKPATTTSGLGADAVSWLRILPDSGTVFAGDSAQIAVTFDAFDLNAGTFNANIQILSNDPDDSLRTVFATLQVIGAPDIFSATDTLDFGRLFTGQRDTLQVKIENRGTDTLRITGVNASPAEFSNLSSGTATLPPDSATVFDIEFAPTTDGAVAGTLELTSNDPDEARFVIVLIGESLPAPVIAVTPDSLYQELFTNGTATQKLTLANNGGTELQFAIAVAEHSGQAIAAQGWRQPSMAESQVDRRRAPISGLYAGDSAIAPDRAPLQLPAGMVTPQAVPIPYTDGFEDGDFKEWIIDDASGKREVTNTTAAKGLFSFTYSNTMQGHYHGIHQEFTPTQLQYISFWVRSGSTALNDGYFVVTANGVLRDAAIFFFARSTGFFFINASSPGGDETFRYNANQWYHIEFKNINWTNKTFDYWVDGREYKTGISMRNASLVNDLDAVYLYNFSQNSQAWWDEISLDSPGATWLSADPLQGTVPANSQIDIAVAFDAGGLQSGDFLASLEFSSNDPLTPKLEVPASLRVLAAPDIAVTPDSLDFGKVFAGIEVTDTLEVSNTGPDSLHVLDIGSDHADVRAAPTAFVLSPGERRAVEVKLTAGQAGLLAATLTISSDDPDEPAVSVGVRANAFVPPKIAVSPDSLAAHLFTGGRESRELEVRNENADGDTLRFLISVEATTGTAAGALLLWKAIPGGRSLSTARVDSKENGLPQPIRWGERVAHPSAKAHSRDARAAYTGAAFTLPVVISDPEGDGISVDVIALRGLSVNDSLHLQVDFAKTIDPNDFGGAVSLDIDQNPNTGSPPSFGLPGQNIGAEFEFFFFDLGTGFVDLFRSGIFIASYPVQISPESIRFGVPLSVLGDDGIMDVTGVLGTGTGPEDWFPDAGHGTIGRGVSWLSASPTIGAVPGGSALAIMATFDATGLEGGDLFADIVFQNNDPDTPELRVPARLSVTGAPDIAVSHSSLDFGQVFIGFSLSDSIVVANSGTDALEVTEITTSDNVFQVDVQSFSLAPGANRSVRVTYSPDQEVATEAALRLVSNDPDEPVVEVSLRGEGKTPPDISVEPAALNLFANPGDSTSMDLVLKNAGSSDLFFEISDQEQQVSVQRHERQLFWSVTSSTPPDSLLRSDIDGNDIRIVNLSSSILGLTVDAQNNRVYWANSEEGAIHAADLDGGNERVVISGLTVPVEIGIDATAGKIYWTDFSANTISRANLDGSDVEIILSGGSGSTAEPGALFAGEGADEPEVRPAVLSSPWGLALDLVNRKIYWTEQTGDRIGRANLDGSNQEILLDASDGIDGPRGIAVDPTTGKIFFVDSFNERIIAANLDGTQMQVLLEFLDADNPLAIDLEPDARKFYWTDNNTDRVSRANYDGSEPETVIQTAVNGFSGPFGVGLGAGAGWLTEVPNQGVILAGESETIRVQANAADLVEGDYSATLFVRSNDPDEPQIEIPVSLRVNRAAVVLAVPDGVAAKPGASLDIAVQLVFPDSVREIAALGAALSASDSVLQFTGHTRGQILNGQNLNVHAPVPDSIRFGLLAVTGAPISAAGTLVTLHFIVDSTAAGGVRTLKFSDLSAAGPDGKSLPISSLDGRFAVITIAIAGTALYCDSDGQGNRDKPVPDLVAELATNGNPVRMTETGADGKFTLIDIAPDRDYRLELGRSRGGAGPAITPTDALLVFQAFLGTTSFTGCQNLAADADGNLQINPVDAGLIFNRFLGRVAQFPIDDWRAFPASYDVNAPAGAWKTAPRSIDYSNLTEDQLSQDFHAVAIGDVDLSWPEGAATAPGAARLLAKGSDMRDVPALVLKIRAPEQVGAGQEGTLRIVAEGDALAGGVYALGGELRFDAGRLEITGVRWGEIVPAAGFRRDHQLLLPASAAPSAAETNQSEAETGRLRFGGFSTSDAPIDRAGTLLELDVRIKTEVEPGAKVPLTIASLSAAAGTAHELPSVLAKGAKPGMPNFAVAIVEAAGAMLEISALPKEFALDRNYPNPFNPVTRIRYQLPAPAQVTLAIYNTLGQRVAVLVENQAQAAGYYALEWDGRDAAGRLLASGVYLYRLDAVSTERSFTKTHKMLLLK